MNFNTGKASKEGKKNYAFIDAQNLHQSSKNWGWKLDYSKFRKFLTEKHNVDVAYLFMGYMQQHAETYTNLQKKGFIIVFREALEYNGQVYKANCDTDLVLRVMIDIDEFSKAIIVSGDGDYVPMLHHLLSKDKLGTLLVPNKSAFSALLKKATKENIDYLNLHRAGLQDDEFAKQLESINLKKQLKNVSQVSEIDAKHILESKEVNLKPRIVNRVNVSIENKGHDLPERQNIFNNQAQAQNKTQVQTIAQNKPSNQTPIINKSKSIFIDKTKESVESGFIVPENDYVENIAKKTNVQEVAKPEVKLINQLLSLEPKQETVKKPEVKVVVKTVKTDKIDKTDKPVIEKKVSKTKVVVSEDEKSKVVKVKSGKVEKTV